MSVTNQSEEYPCRGPDCAETFGPETAVAGSFCSSECHARKRGRDALRQIDSLHGWCSTCFRPVKDVISRQEYQEWRDNEAKGREELPDNFVGTQHETLTTDTGVVDHKDNEAYYRPVEHGRWGCECGAVNPSTREEAIQAADTQLIVQSLWSCLVRLERKGAIQSRPDKGAYFDALETHWKDWPYAVGESLK